MRQKVTTKRAAFIRNNAQGYVGGEVITKRATDSELVRLARLQDKVGQIHNLLRERYWDLPQYRKRKASLQRQSKTAQQQIRVLQSKIRRRKPSTA